MEDAVGTLQRLTSRYSQMNLAIADQGMISMVSFLTGALLARQLGLEEFGRFSLVWIAVIFAGTIHHAVINSPMMSIGVKLPDDEWPRYFGAILIQNVVFCAAGFLVFLIFCLVLSVAIPSWKTLSFALPLALCTAAVQTQDLLRRYCFTRNLARQAFVIDMVRYGGQMVILFILFFGWLGFSGVELNTTRVLWIITLTSMGSAALGFVFLREYTFSLDAAREYTRRHLSFSSWLTASVLMNWLTAHLFILGGGAILGSWAVGVVKATQTLMGVCHVFFFAMENFVTPRAAWHASNSGRERFSDYLKSVSRFGGVATAVLALLAIAIPKFWLVLAFGEEYGDYGYVLRIHAVAYLVLYFTLPLKAGLRAIEKTEKVFVAEAGAALFAIATVYFLVSGWQLTGVVIGILAVHLIQVALLARGMQSEMDEAFADNNSGKSVS